MHTRKILFSLISALAFTMTFIPSNESEASSDAVRPNRIRPSSSYVPSNRTSPSHTTTQADPQDEVEFEVEILDDQDAELFLSRYGISDEHLADGVPIIRETYRPGDAHLYFVRDGKASKRGSCMARSGEASWYGPGFHGRKTASGERFNQNDRTAAHRTLPFGTRVRVTYKGRSTIVTINDAGPYSGNRVIDLSRQAAADIGLIKPGHGKVTLEVLSCG